MEKADRVPRSELDRIARQTGAKHSMGQVVYDTAS
jgi:type IV secretion system protein VirB5